MHLARVLVAGTPLSLPECICGVLHLRVSTILIKALVFDLAASWLPAQPRVLVNTLAQSACIRVRWGASSSSANASQISAIRYEYLKA